MTTTDILKDLEPEADMLHQSIRLALEIGDHQDTTRAIAAVRKVKALIDKLYELEPRLEQK